MIFFKRINSKYIFFLLGILITIPIFLLLFKARKKLNIYLGRWPIPYQERIIDQPQNYNWFDPSKNHFIKSNKELLKTRNNLYSYIINRNQYKVNASKSNKLLRFRFLNNLLEIEKINFKHKKGINTNAFYLKPKNELIGY